MSQLYQFLAVLLLTLVPTACGGVADHVPVTCLEGQDYRFGYSGERSEFHTAIPGEELCYEGERAQWCLYRGASPSDGTNLLGPDAVADDANPDTCAPGS